MSPRSRATATWRLVRPTWEPSVGDLRRVPAGLALSYVAAGRFDAAVLVDTKLWDVAAGLLIAAEAG
ncbi:MAG TPA: inositol monophosphatase family protein, partial [Blastococcus sp.]